MANQTRESSSAATKKPLYSPHVFLSFAGKDTRHGFTSHLYAALRKRGINTFRDDKTTRKGQFFGEEVEAAIKESKICIVVFSEGYRYSKWCLIELELIHKCVKAKIYPIFYKIEPSDIRGETKFEIAMKELNKKQKAKNKPEFSLEQMKKWWDALLSVGGLQGYPLQEGFDEAELIERIVTDVFKLVPKLLDVGQHIVGLESRVQEVKSLLDIGSESSNNSVCMLLIHGIGGIGKTTLAKLFYNEIVYQFKGASFLFNVKEATSNQPNGLASLQKLLLKEAHGEDIAFGNDAVGATKIKKLLRNKKILLVLDDVDDKKQLNKLAGGCDWFGSGSRIIVTSRNSRLLNENQVHKVYEMEELIDSAALECLCWYAFDDSQPAKGFEEVTRCMVKYAKGLPLALEVIGSDLNCEGLEEWKCALHDYEKNQHPDILCILERSYYRLGRNERRVFLDVAWFFKGKKKIHVEMLSNDHKRAITVLEHKSLIKVTSGILTIHDLIQQMGKEIVFKKNPGDPSMVEDDEAINVLINDSGPGDIEGMIISAHEDSRVIYPKRLRPGQVLCVDWSGTAFCKMNNLRTLIITNATFSKPPTYLPNNLSWLHWIAYPSGTLPSNFSPNKLVVLELPNSPDISDSILGPPLKGAYLSCLNLSFCPLLHVIPDMSGFLNLRELILCECENLTKVDDSVGLCSKLIYLNLYGCGKLECLPHKIKMPSLEFVNLDHCGSLQHFPDIEGQINTLESIQLVGLEKIKKLPESINNITGLKVLSLHNCSELEEMPLLKLRNLEEVRIKSCPRVSFRKSQAMQDNDSEAVSCPNLRQLSIVDSHLSDDSLATILSWYRKLKCLTLVRSLFTSIPQSIEELVDLLELDVSHCPRLQNIPELPSKLSTIHAYRCESLTLDSKTKLVSQACKGIVGLHISFDLPESEISIPSQFRRLSNCAGIVSFQIGQTFPFAAFAFILKRKLPEHISERHFHLSYVQIFINGLFVLETRSIGLETSEVIIVDLQNFDKRKDPGVFLVNDWNDVDIGVFNCYGKCVEQLEVYGVLCNEEQIARCPLIWRTIWSWPGPKRIRDFLWLMVQEKLFTNSQRRSQQLTNSDSCPRCGSSGETVMHMIRDCESIANLWQKAIKPCHWECFSSTSVCKRDWVLMNLLGKLGSDDGLDWKVNFGFACWNIWKNRNDLAVDNSANGAIDHGDRARESIEAISRAIESQSHAHLGGLNSWNLPPNDWVKLIVIIFLREGVVNCGCAIQDATGSWIFEFTMVPDQDILERTGKNLGFQIGKWTARIARMKGLNKVIMEILDADGLQLSHSAGSAAFFLGENWWPAFISQTIIVSEDISRKRADLVHNSEQYSIDFATFFEWLGVAGFGGQLRARGYKRHKKVHKRR